MGKEDTRSQPLASLYTQGHHTHEHRECFDKNKTLRDSIASRLALNKILQLKNILQLQTKILRWKI